eukprot:5704154-Heterocapsa_arctica.AAC.1
MMNNARDKADTYAQYENEKNNKRKVDIEEPHIVVGVGMEVREVSQRSEGEFPKLYSEDQFQKKLLDLDSLGHRHDKRKAKQIVRQI